MADSTGLTALRLYFHSFFCHLLIVFGNVHSVDVAFSAYHTHHIGLALYRRVAEVFRTSDID